ncbi:hypothetical protein MBLNU230_g0575t2 [Neophaeotheca triangularis]
MTVAVQQGASAPKFAVPAAIATGRAFTVQQRRHAAAQVVPEEEAANKILATQRRHRPVSPHLGIYQPQITWYLSMLNRLTGVTLSGGFYVFGIGYLVGPYIGLHMESAVLAASFATWPVALKLLTKTFVALPFTFHSFNGIRHLMWDTATGMTNKQVQQTGWACVGLSVVSAVALAFM